MIPDDLDLRGLSTPFSSTNVLVMASEEIESKILWDELMPYR